MVAVSSGCGSQGIYIAKLLQELKREVLSKMHVSGLSYILFILNNYNFKMPLEGVKDLKIFIHANAGRIQQRKGESDMTIKKSFTALTLNP